MFFDYMTQRGLSVSVIQIMNRRKSIWGESWQAVILLVALVIGPSVWAQNRINFNNQNLFLNGANFAWKNFAADVGPGTTDVAYFSSVFSQVHGSGGNCMRLWLHTNGANSPAWTGTGPNATVTGPGTGTITDIQALLSSGWSNKVSVVLCLWSFDMLRSAYGTNITDRARNILTNDAALGTYITNALIPMVQALKGNPAIMAWEIFNEPDGMSLELGWPNIVTNGRVPMAAIQKFVNRCAGTIHDFDPNAKVTDGSSSFTSQSDVGAGNTNYYRDDRLIAAGGCTNGTLDFYCVHYYDPDGATLSPFQNNYSHWGLTKPLVVAEFYPNVADGCTSCGNTGFNTLYTNGYAGALAWSWTDSPAVDMLAQMASVSNAHPADVTIVIANTVALTSPTNGSVFALGSTMTIVANPAYSTGSVTNVQFFQGATKLGEDNTSPYQYNWTNPPAGFYSITARSTDNGGLMATSAPVSIAVGLTRLEAENAAYSGVITVGTAALASGGKYLNMQANGTVTWTITNVPAVGSYNVSFGYYLPYGDKPQFLWVNGVSNSIIDFAPPISTWQATSVTVALNAGTNTISIIGSYGYMYFDYLELLLNTPPAFAAPPANRTVPVLSLMTVTNNATDSDLPTQTLTYQLLNPPGGAAIDANGVITWTPGNPQAPSTNQFNTVASDGLVNVTNSFQVIVKAAPGLALFSSLNPAGYLTAVNFTATITNTATGFVTFQANGSAFSTNTVSGGSATSLPLANLPPGTNIISAIYSGDSNYLGSTNSLIQIVKTLPGLVLVSSLNPASYLTPVNFTATMTNNATGTVIFQAIGSAFSTNSVSGGSATSLMIANLPRSTNVITAIYSGDSTYLGNTITLGQVVVKATVGLALVSSQSPAGYRTAVNFTATVINTATGMVIFMANGLAFSTNTLSGGSATSLSIANLLPGTNVITAVYGGDNNYLSNSNTFSQVVTALTRYEAENSAYTGAITVGTNALASGGKYLNMQANGTITWTLTSVPAAGNYNVSFGYCLPYGYKEQFRWVNGVSNCIVAFPLPTDTWQAINVSVPLTAGTNTISLRASWGYMFFDYLELLLNTPPVFAATPANRTIAVLTLMTVTNNAIDSDVPAQTLTYQLSNPPDGAVIDANGVITWTPDNTQAPATNQIATVVSDGVVNVTNSFQVSVTAVPIPPVQIYSLNWSATTGFQFSFDVPAGVNYTIEAADPLGTWTNLFIGVGQAGLETFMDTNAIGHGQRFYRIRF